MPLVKAPPAPPAIARRALLFPFAVLSVVFRAVLGSILGISTASLFGVAGLVVFAGFSLELAVTIVALGMNAMLLCLVLLGNLDSDGRL